MNKLPEKRMKELIEHLTNARLIIEELVQMTDSHYCTCDDNGTITDVITDTYHEMYDAEDNVKRALYTLAELRHADLTPYSPPSLSRPD